MALKEHNALRSRAAKLKSWWRVGDEWRKLTNAEARREATRAINRGDEFRKATVDEEFELEGI